MQHIDSCCAKLESSEQLGISHSETGESSVVQDTDARMTSASKWVSLSPPESTTLLRCLRLGKSSFNTALAQRL